MSRAAEFFGSRRAPHVAALALIAFGVAGCSGDTTRFSQSSLGNPFNYQPEATGSVPAQPAQTAAPRELPQYNSPQSPSYQSSSLPAPPVSTPQPYPAQTSAGVSGGGRGLASYTPPPRPKLEVTGTVPVPPRSVAAARPQGGTTIIVGTSDTLEILAQRYHVTPAAILAANGYKGPRTLSPGQSLIIPHANVAGAPVPAAPASRPVASVAPSVHVVNRGDTLAGIARRNHVSLAELARANNLDPSAKLKLGTKLAVPGAKMAEAAPVTPQTAAVQPIAPAPPTSKLALAGLQQSARLAQANPAPDPVEANPPAVKPSEATGALPTFRWPVRGKVITGYGAKTNGKSNDGINLAVPEGTPVKAAEDGVVAYSGNELKGYGNLVLVRHSNGYVTAYAHASELLVKRGDTIKRGQVIAKSGQSGEVGSPQLHFEIRKGSQPVDPLQFLNGA
jgi:murein DD-endopeptidase MepM/ murein hydrolase activator NlpD